MHLLDVNGDVEGVQELEHKSSCPDEPLRVSGCIVAPLRFTLC